jgi:hypothetical protein
MCSQLIRQHIISSNHFSHALYPFHIETVVSYKSDTDLYIVSLPHTIFSSRLSTKIQQYLFEHKK